MPVLDLALPGSGATVKSWEPRARSIAGHELSKAVDGSLHTYWSADAFDMPVDLGVEWEGEKTVSSLVVRYFDGRMVRGPAVARTQQWAQIQYWTGEKWHNVVSTIYGQETSSVRYTFAPVTTKRIRLLFTEPPDPESRSAPDRLGIYVSEFEVYASPYFQAHVSPPGYVRPMLSPWGNSFPGTYNEPAQGDGRQDIPGPTIMEPKISRTYRDELRPNLIVESSRWAKEPAGVSISKGRPASIGNGFLSLTFSGAKESILLNRVTGEVSRLPGSVLFRIKTAEAVLQPESCSAPAFDGTGTTASDARLRLDFECGTFGVSVHYQLRQQDHFLHKWLVIRNHASSSARVLDVTVSSLGIQETLDLMAGAELTYPISRMAKGGFFSALETVYWDHVGDTLTYYPGAVISPGVPLVTEKAVLGVYQNRGEDIAGWDRGVREWITEYHAQVSPIPSGWPDVYCEGWSGNFGIKEMLEQPERAERRMDVADRIGIRYLDTYEPAHAALSSPKEWVDRWVDLAERHHVKTGWWADQGSAYDWGIGGVLSPAACKLTPEYDQYLEDIVNLVKQHRLGAMHWGDFLEIWPCENPPAGYLPGKYSIYAQGQRILRFAQELHEANPEMMLGADGGLTNPQYVRYADSRSYGIIPGGDNPYGYDHYPATEPDIHLDRLYAELNRNYFYDLQTVYLRPWFRLLNIVNHYSHEGTHSHDRAGFRFSLLSALSMGAQVTFDDIPPEMPDSEIRFAHDWIRWAQDHKEYFVHGDRLFDRTVSHSTQWTNDPDALSGFSHIRGDRGLIALINPGVADQTAQLAIQLEGSGPAMFSVKDVYPEGVQLQGPVDGLYRQGDLLSIDVPAKQVRFVWIEPAGKVRAVSGAGKAIAPVRQARYLSYWQELGGKGTSVTYAANFRLPSSGAEALKQPADESFWAKEPWAYDKAYLVILLKDETMDALSSDVPDNLVSNDDFAALALRVNGIPKTVRPFVTGRGVRKGRVRCYFVGLGEETKVGSYNRIEVTLPIRRGLVFSGVYIDLPDQMPYSLPPSI